MTYVVRNTFTPEADIQRGWSGWIGCDWASEREALVSLTEESGVYFDLLDRHPEWSDDELIEEAISRSDWDVRYNAAWGRWQHVHHSGLSCWPLEAETEAEAWAEARTGEFEWHGFGKSTAGQVRLVGHVRDNLYLFEADDTGPED